MKLPDKVSFPFKIQYSSQPELRITNLGWKESSLTIHNFFSGTCFHVAGSARSTRALALRRPKPKRLLTISPAPFLFHPGLLDRGSNSEVQTTMCCRSLHVRSGLKVQRQPGRRVRQLALNYNMRAVMGAGILRTSVPRPGQIFRQPAGQRLKFPCESGCTRCADRRSSGGGGERGKIIPASMTLTWWI